MSTDAEQSSREDAERFFGSHTTAAPVSALPPLAPVEQRANEFAEELWWIARDVMFSSPLIEEVVYRLDFRRWFYRAALVAIPIWRRAQERIAQRTAEIVLAKLADESMREKALAYVDNMAGDLVAEHPSYGDSEGVVDDALADAIEAAYLAGHRAAREEASREIEAMTQRARDGAPPTCYGLDDLAAKIRGAG